MKKLIIERDKEKGREIEKKQDKRKKIVLLISDVCGCLLKKKNR